MAATGTDINHAASLLAKGELVAIPTETVYGLAANALNEQAVLRIFQVKKRPFFDPLIVHVPSIEAAEQYATLADERLLALARRYWPGPLTLLLPKKPIIPGIVTSGLDRVGIRVPSHRTTLGLLNLCTFPLAAPSANPFGYISPTLAVHVEKQLGDNIPYILDGGNCSIGIESTIVGLEHGVLCIYRLGGLAVEAIEKIAGRAILKLNQSSDPSAPGQLHMHYAPSKKLLLGNVKDLAPQFSGEKIDAIVFGAHETPASNIHLRNLSERGDVNEAALNLFRILRECDESDSTLIIAETVPAEGLGAAINDRLKRAAAR